MRIAIVIPSYFPIWGGAQTQVRRLAHELARRGDEVEIVTWKRDSSLPSYERPDGVLIRRIDRWQGGILPTVWAFVQMAYTLTRVARQADILVARHLLSTAFLAGFAAVLTGTPIISVPAAGSDQPRADLNMMTGNRASRRLRRALAWPLRRGAVIALSSWTAENLQELGFRHIVRIPNGVEDTGVPDRIRLRRELYRPLGIPSNTKVVAAAGRLVDVKGFDVLIAAWRQVSATRDDAVAVIVGSGPEEAALRAAAADAGVAESVHFVPFSSRARDYLGAADLAVMPSRFEGLSNVLLEAMMDGVPVVATAVSGAVDFIDDGINGRLVSPEDPNALAAAVIDVLRAPRNMGLCGRETVLTQCEVTRVIDQYLWLFSTYHSLPAGVIEPVGGPKPHHPGAQEARACAESAE